MSVEKGIRISYVKFKTIFRFKKKAFPPFSCMEEEQDKKGRIRHILDINYIMGFILIFNKNNFSNLIIMSIPIVMKKLFVHSIFLYLIHFPLEIQRCFIRLMKHYSIYINLC